MRVGDVPRRAGNPFQPTRTAARPTKECSKRDQFGHARSLDHTGAPTGRSRRPTLIRAYQQCSGPAARCVPVQRHRDSRDQCLGQPEIPKVLPTLDFRALTAPAMPG